MDVLSPTAGIFAAAGVGASLGAATTATAATFTTKSHIFLDETVPSFFRRPTWTPDGSLLLVPTGCVRGEGGGSGGGGAGAGGGGGGSGGGDSGATLATTFAFSRASFAEPVAHFPGAGSARPSIAVRASPILYSHRGSDARQNGVFTLPYRMLFAVATLDSVLVYDTSRPHPVAAVANLHYDKLTDIAWSPSGHTLLLSSVDGYCSILCFDDADLGVPLPRDEWPAILRARKHVPTYAPPRPKRTPAHGAGAGVGAGAAAAAAAAEDEEGEGGEGVPTSAPTPPPAPAAPIAGAKRKIALTLLAPLGEVFIAPAAVAVVVVVEPMTAPPICSVEPEVLAQPQPRPQPQLQLQLHPVPLVPVVTVAEPFSFGGGGTGDNGLGVAFSALEKLLRGGE